MVQIKVKFCVSDLTYSKERKEDPKNIYYGAF